MERLTYISRFANTLSSGEIDQLGETAARHNSARRITGVLICLRGYFFQILEGDGGTLQALFKRIAKDPRHRDVLLLKRESGVHERLFPDWSMRTFNLDHETGLMVQPVRELIATLLESHALIEKYTQPAVRRIIESGADPLRLAPRRVRRVLVMSDIFGFSALSERHSVEDVFAVASHYLDICHEEVSNRGGEVSKFIGDSVLAYFPDGEVDAALNYAVSCLERFRAIRRGAQQGEALARLYAGFGIHIGSVMEGTVGSKGKRDYTVIGDAVNTAARVESLTRKLGAAILVTAEVANTASDTWRFKSLGHQTLKGKAIRVQMLSPELPIVRDVPLGS
jgi:adenylate cyclase